MAKVGAEQVAALPWRRRRGTLEILLVTSRETRRWLVPRGWRMLNLIDSNAAKREAYEEAGVDGRVQRKPIGRYTYVKRSANGIRRTCHVTVYALLVLQEHRRWPEREERVRQWFVAAEAARMVREATLRAVIRSFAEASVSATAGRSFP